MPIDPSEDQTEIEQTTAVSPGSMLRQARIERGLDEKDIAERLHITVHYVKAIEGDHYEKLPGIVFAKGYLKSYATAVGVDPELVLQSFSLTQPGQQQEKTQLRSGSRKKSRNRGAQWGAVASIACFALLISVAWYFSDTPDPESVRPELSGSGQERIPEPVAEPITPEVPEAEIAPAADTPQDDSLNGEPDFGAVEDKAIALRNDTLELPEPQELVDSTPEDQAAVVESESQVPADDVANAGAVDDLVVAEVQASNSSLRPEDLTDVNVLQGENGERIIAVDAHGEDVLRISFSGESWVEINDGDDRQIYRDLREQGDILEVSGHAPFNVLLGDAPYTSLNFNGADVDVTGNIRIDNSARLTVGL